MNEREGGLKGLVKDGVERRCLEVVRSYEATHYRATNDGWCSYELNLLDERIEYFLSARLSGL